MQTVLGIVTMTEDELNKQLMVYKDAKALTIIVKDAKGAIPKHKAEIPIVPKWNLATGELSPILMMLIRDYLDNPQYTIELRED